MLNFGAEAGDETMDVATQGGAILPGMHMPPAGLALAVPDTLGHPAPPLPAHDHVTDAIPAGMGSPTRVPGAAALPVLLTVTV